ncbi:hypothetical protein LCM17_04565 [Cereibacter sphaeroides]|nr:hypothetical protein [Cereibacter sphaeroides]
MSDTPDITTPDFAALVGSRLCHDLVSPLGAIGNGVELMRMMQALTPELELIEQAVESAQARVRLFRLAFGAAKEGQDVPAREFAEALAGLAVKGKVRVRTALPTPLPRPQVKRLALAALCAESALAFGGELAVGQDSVCALSPRLKLDPALWEALERTEAPADMVPATVHFGLLAATGPVQIENAEDGLTIRV